MNAEFRTLPTRDNGKKRFIVSSISSDSHTWNLVYLQMVIEEQGHEVINLGACVPHEEIVDACLRYRPDGLVLSSVNGHGNIEGMQIIGRIRDRSELADMATVIGGKLGIRGTENADFTPALLRAGFDDVFSAEDGMERFIEFINASGESGRLEPVALAA